MAETFSQIESPQLAVEKKAGRLYLPLGNGALLTHSDTGMRTRYNSDASGSR